MRKILKKIGNGMLFGLGFLMILGFGYYMVSARNGLVASPGDKLTATQWNTLASGSLNSASLFTCTYSDSANGRTSHTWLVSDCGGVTRPQNFTKCLWGVAFFDMYDSFSLIGHTITKDTLSFAGNINPGPRTVGINYLCRN